MRPLTCCLQLSCGHAPNATPVCPPHTRGHCLPRSCGHDDPSCGHGNCPDMHKCRACCFQTPPGQATSKAAGCKSTRCQTTAGDLPPLPCLYKRCLALLAHQWPDLLGPDPHFVLALHELLSIRCDVHVSLVH